MSFVLVPCLESRITGLSGGSDKMQLMELKVAPITLRLNSMSLTNDREIYPRVPSWGVPKVHTTPINALVLQLDVVDEQLGGVGGNAKVGTVRKERG